MNKKIEVFTDGGSRGNPGISAFAFVVLEDGVEIFSGSGFLGISTNNKAEYTGLLEGLKFVLDKNLSKVSFYSDSELMVKQIKGEYKVKDEDLKNFHRDCKDLISKLENFEIIHVRREKNKKADLLVNKVLDEQ